MVMYPPGLLILGEALVWVQVLHCDLPHGNVPRCQKQLCCSDDVSPRSNIGWYHDDMHTKLVPVLKCLEYLGHLVANVSFWS